MAAGGPGERRWPLFVHPQRTVVLAREAAGLEAQVAAAGADRVEDGFSVLDLASRGFRVEYRNEVMARPPGPPPPAAGDGIARVTDLEGLQRAERTLIEAFWRSRGAGEILPAAALALPGWATWLTEDGAGSVTAYDDGRSLGIYWLGVRPEARSRGLGRALMAVALAWRPDRVSVLSSTADGLPLYASLGFERAGTATWWLREREQ